MDSSSARNIVAYPR